MLCSPAGQIRGGVALSEAEQSATIMGFPSSAVAIGRRLLLLTLFY